MSVEQHVLLFIAQVFATLMIVWLLVAFAHRRMMDGLDEILIRVDKHDRRT